MGRTSHSLWGNPYWVFSRFRFREITLRAYILREHQRGRPLADVMSDPYVQRFGPNLPARILVHPLTIAALERHDAEAIAGYSEQLQHN